ncbi:MAG: cytochrome c biogenesis protein ResB [Lentisphaeria bacterium]|nr:cytochrome c biogenesis protein ResB [Lentisphaeria bacterium]
MTFAIYLLLVTTVLMIVGGIPVSSGDVTVIFNSPIFILLGVLISLSCFIACFKVKISKKTIPFFINHISIILIILGVFLSIFFERKGEFNPPLGEDYAVYQVPQPMTRDGMRPIYNDIKLDFGISFSDFKISYFSPSYALFKPTEKTAVKTKNQPDYTFVESAKVKNDQIHFANGSTVLKKDLLNEFTKEWKKQLVQPDGTILQLQGLMEREYTVMAKIFDKERNVMKEQVVKINYPIDYDGWRFYLMSYDKERGTSITVLAKNDPGIPFVTYGLWMLLIGVFAFSITQLLVEVKKDYAN